jgi:pimeloyl-ACP methyl ester carboxylesterase
MAVAANIRTWFRGSSGASLHGYVRSRGHLVFLVSAGVILIHLLTQAFFNPEPMSDAGGNIVTGIAGPALVVGLTLAYPHLHRGWRAIAALGLGLFAVVTAIGIHLPHLVAVGATARDVTAISSLVAGVALVGMGLVLAWKAMPRLWLKIALIPAVPIVLLQVVLPLTLATFVVNTPRQALGDASPADYGLTYEDVTFQNDEGETLAAWYIPSENGAAVILVHGSGKNRTKTLDHAAMLAKNGYGSLMVDLQGYGESEGSPVAWGWTGETDVGAAVDYLKTRDDLEPGRIGALGLSMGGEVVMHAAGENDGISAVVSEGAGMHTWKEFEQEPGGSFLKYRAIFNVSTAYETVELLSGRDQPPSNMDQLQKIAPRPVLLISTGKSEEGNWGRLLYEAAGPTAQLWETGGGHIDGLAEQPEEYEKRVVSLFDDALLGD